jgi:hypothetical protein
VALAVLALWRDHRSVRQLFTTPGMAVCGLTILGLIYGGLWIFIGWLVGTRNFGWPLSNIILLGSYWSGPIIVGSWLTLIFSGVARDWWRDADWKEWCGVAIGCFWIAGRLITHAIHFAL